MKTHNEVVYEVIAIKIRNIINEELFANLATPINICEMKKGYEEVIKILENIK
jgi:hypothetical protein